ncbi:hypothetical protein PNEG_03607 [Pneumocystis murina B123]|uniref:Uncharacterized protein n=1 Tax=Pneumocystis murina (strain B123) TaxID=1069680 RepID=M7P968_PNEMU|nr:hypothetical protein PNEG_03607 [Pneumocystis murina B123]EMR10390.1 hypothetical protein PNEG_03607 [Pneumocystis murina B123]
MYIISKNDNEPVSDYSIALNGISYLVITYVFSIFWEIYQEYIITKILNSFNNVLSNMMVIKLFLSMNLDNYF